MLRSAISDSPVSTDEDLQRYDNNQQEGEQDALEEEEEEKEEISTPPKASPEKKKTIHERSLHGMQIFIARNAYPRTEPKRYILTTFEKLLKDSMNLVGLNDQAKKVFTKDGTLVNSIDGIKEKDLLYISCGEKFGYGSPVKRPLPKYDKVRSPSKSDATEKSEVKSPKVDSPTKSKEEIKLEHKQARFQNEILSFQRTLTVSQKTVDQCLRESSAAVYAQLLENQRLRLPKWEVLQEEHDQTQLSMLIDHLIYHHICQSTNVILPQTNEWAMDLLKNISIDSIKFAFFGPRQSGKTTMLHLFTTMLMRKLQKSDTASQYLFFPVNFETLTLELSNIRQILRFYIKNTFDALEYSHMAFLPFLTPLRKWFTFTVFGSTAQFPTQIDKQFPGVDIKALQELAKKVNTAFLNNHDKVAIKIFLDTVFSIPSAISHALGLTGVIYVFDNFEYADKYLMPSEDCFPDAVKPSSISQSLCDELQNHSYIVSYQEEQQFLTSFTCNNAELIEITNSYDIHKEEDEKKPPSSPRSNQKNKGQEAPPPPPPEPKDCDIIIRHPAPLRLSKDNCLGCPGLVDKYKKLVKLVRQYQNNKVSNPYSLTKSSSEHFREMIVKKEILRFISLLYHAGSDLINNDVLNKFIDGDSIAVKLDEKEEKSEDETQDQDQNQSPSRNPSRLSRSSRSQAKSQSSKAKSQSSQAKSQSSQNQSNQDLLGENNFNIKENVKNLGGNVDGVLRFSIQWNDLGTWDKNELDACCIVPSGFEIMHGNNVDDSTGGNLDVDVTDQKEGEVACKNIIWTDIDQMEDGQYRLFVRNNCYKNGHSGFRAEIEFENHQYSCDYQKTLQNEEEVDVAYVTLSDGQFSITPCLTNQ